MPTTSQHLGAVALSFSGAEERQEDGMTLYCVGARIFAAVAREDQAILNLNADQQAWVIETSDAFSPVEGEAGTAGRTLVNLARVDIELLADILTMAHGNAAKSGLSALGDMLGGATDD